MRFILNQKTDWENVARYVDTDVSYENGVFKGAKLHTKAGGKAFYYSFGYFFEINIKLTN